MAVAPEIQDLVKRLSAGETATFSPAERVAARSISKHVGIRKDASTGSMIVAWFPWTGDGDEDDVWAESLAMPGGDAVEDLHLTLLYLGDSEQYDVDLVAAALKLFTVQRCWPLRCELSGIGRFVGEGDNDIIVALVDAPDLAYFRDSLKECLAELGVWVNETHGFLPHITLGSIPMTQSAPVLAEKSSFEIDALSLAAGAFRVEFEFPGYAEMNEQDPTPFLAARRAVETVAKTGKVLSAKNMKIVKDAAAALDALISPAPVPASKAYVDLPHDGEPELTNFVTKASTEERYTFGPLYAPNRKDAHGEFTDAETLQKAVWDYVRESSDQGRRIRLQHDDSENPETIGEWVEICAWPYETTVKMSVPGEAERELIMPEGTIYIGVKWDEPAWEAIKSKRLTGYSLGGRAVRASFPGLDLEHMGDKLAAAKHEFEASAKDPKMCGSCGMSQADGNHLSAASGE